MGWCPCENAYKSLLLIAGGIFNNQTLDYFSEFLLILNNAAFCIAVFRNVTAALNVTYSVLCRMITVHNILACFRRGQGQSQLSVRPRSLQVSENTATTTPSSATVLASSSTMSNSGSNSNSTTNGEGGGDKQKPMSNSDFRQMLLGTKK